MSGSSLPIELFDYFLPEELIAQKPACPRDSSKLMVLIDHGVKIEHSCFQNISNYLNENDLLVFNQTKVIPARLWLKRQHGKPIEILLWRPIEIEQEKLQDAKKWLCLGRPQKLLKTGKQFLAQDGTLIEVIGRQGQLTKIKAQKPFWKILQKCGDVPLPPYIQRETSALESDIDDYQTIYAKIPGAVAAPTAGLHFTPAIMERLQKQKVRVANLVLHVGPGTFLPVRQENYLDVRNHEILPEWYQIPDKTLEAISMTQKRGGRIIAVGTTSVRALETCALTNSRIGETSLFIYPGFKFNVVEGLITNFHLPRSSLLMLVSALVGRENILKAYQQAIDLKYRFYSYGDGMLVL